MLIWARYVTVWCIYILSQSWQENTIQRYTDELEEGGIDDGIDINSNVAASSFNDVIDEPIARGQGLEYPDVIGESNDTGSSSNVAASSLNYITG